MIRTVLSCAIALFVATGSSAWADGDAEAGKARSGVCSACHGADGNSVNPQWPSLAGQHAAYIVSQLAAYKSGTRSNALMTPMAMPLDEQAQKDLGAFYATQSHKGGTADPNLVDAGEKLYRGGNPATGVSACAACHGPNGQGNPDAKMPMIAGQHATYTAEQLRLYASGERRSDMEQMMRNIAAQMSDAEIEAVASYIQGLR
ncbi:MAG: cytochrome c4 [Gammaproteobacteria bacterium]|nr:cytochrome c4 [Gammaproteobacteria bacterium]MDH3769140.1 cytochrome c4 [Gammaproteobacteria bacterium]